MKSGGKYKVVATVDNGGTEEDITIYSRYKTILGALRGAVRFCSRCYGVSKIVIDVNTPPAP